MNEIKIYCEGEEVETVNFEDRESAENYFDTYPLDDTADKIELWGIDPWGDFDLLDERVLVPDLG